MVISLFQIIVKHSKFSTVRLEQNIHPCSGHKQLRVSDSLLGDPYHGGGHGGLLEASHHKYVVG